MESGVVRERPISGDFVEGHDLVARLHDAMRRFVGPGTTFHCLHEFANDVIREAGFENLDFMGNVGHSICTRLENRVYIESGNNISLGDVAAFTFEPHVRKSGGRWGFKREDIYSFDDFGKLVEI
jgi:Xaa-Pro aminopeptidase